MSPRVTNYINRFRGFSRNTKLLLLSAFFGSIGPAVIWLLLNFYFQALGYSETLIGWLNAIPFWTTALSGIPIGFISDRLPRKVMLIAATALIAVGNIGIAFLASPVMLIFFSVLVGLGFTTLLANTSPFLAENSTMKQRTVIFSVQAALTTATGFIGNLLGGHFPEFFSLWLGGQSHDVWPLRWTLGMVAGLQLVAVFPLLLVSSEKQTLEKQAWRLEHPKLFVKMLLPSMIIGLGAGQVMPYLNVFVKGKFSISFEELGWLFALSSLVTALGMLLQPLLADRFGKVRSVIIVQIVSMPFLLMLGFSPFFFLTAIAFLVRGMLMNMANPVYMAFCMERLSKRERATFSGAYEVVWSVGWASSAAFSGWWRDQVGFDTGFDTAFSITTTCYVVATFLLYWFFARHEQAPAKRKVFPSYPPAQE